ncbi:hypothetical protein FQR65_LT02994 [Abscondita terminalis]|nr:hypothetical protein FQR65_LT02994 [Abscondita terminalis]
MGSLIRDWGIKATMKSPLLDIYFLVLICTPLACSEYLYEVNYLDVPVDHFSFTNNKTFKLRYLVNDSYWNNDGPIFFYTGNEGDINNFAQNTGFMWEIAPSFRALLIFAEHRYYGESLPYGNQSFSNPEHVGYLHSAQALADFVDVIEHIQSLNNYFTDSYKNPVIAFGGSYGGMLSAWLRMKYPASVLGAVASSAPILQFQTPCDIFNKIVTSVFKISSRDDCSGTIKRTWPAIREITSTPAGREWLSNNWKLCTPLQESEVPALIDWLSEVYGNMAMVNYPYPTDFLVDLPGHPVRKFCKKLSNNNIEPKALVENLGKALNVYTNFTKNQKCVKINETTNNSIGGDGWDFQACTEMIMPMCSTKYEMFEVEPWNFTKFTESCFSRWKVRVAQSNLAILEYGGKYLNAASNIIFSNGLLDPWSGGGVLHNISNSVIAIIIPDSAHHLDLRARNPEDPYSVIEARSSIQKIIRKWLKTYYQDFLNMYYD